MGSLTYIKKVIECHCLGTKTIMSRYKKITLEAPLEVSSSIPYRPPVIEVLKKMNIGDSFWISPEDKKRIAMSIFRTSKSLGIGFDNVEERQKGILGYRYWRVR